MTHHRADAMKSRMRHDVVIRYAYQREVVHVARAVHIRFPMRVKDAGEREYHEQDSEIVDVEHFDPWNSRTVREEGVEDPVDIVTIDSTDHPSNVGEVRIHENTSDLSRRHSISDEITALVAHSYARRIEVSGVVCRAPRTLPDRKSHRRFRLIRREDEELLERIKSAQNASAGLAHVC